MATFGFGRLIERDSRRGREEVAEYRLHIQSQWRIVRNDKLLVGYGDWHYPPRGSSVSYRDFDEADAPVNRRDELMAAWFAHRDPEHIVQAIRGTEAGDLEIAFNDLCILETFANQAFGDGDGDDEFWRLLPPPSDGDKPHFVVTAHGLDR